MSRSTVTAVRRALNAYSSGWLLGSRFRLAARMICADAHRHGLRAEQMLVALKREWAALPDVLRMSDRRARVDLLNHLVTCCIEGFYTPKRTARPRPARTTRARGAGA